MHPFVQEFPCAASPEQLVEQLRGEPGIVCLRTAQFESVQGRYSLVTARPLLTVRAFGARGELRMGEQRQPHFGDPWPLLDALMGRFELLDELDLPFPLGGCFGYWGYDLKQFLEPRLPRRAESDLDLPDCHVAFHGSLVVFDHALGKTWIIATGFHPDGSRSDAQARRDVDDWKARLDRACAQGVRCPTTPPDRLSSGSVGRTLPSGHATPAAAALHSTFTREGFIRAVERIQRYIRSGDIYQANLAQRLEAPCPLSGWDLFTRLTEISPAPFAAYLAGDGFEVASSSPELFLRLHGSQIHTRPIKGTRPRSADADEDARLSYELQSSPKELAELVMITDLLRNDLGKVCEYGSVRVPELVRLERYAHVQHLVSTVEGQLRPGLTHLAALAACFPGGSITGAPKIRAMEIIDELEPVARGPYTGCLGYLGFNRQSQLSIIIRTALRREERVYCHVGAGIVADSDPAAEYAETMAKAGGFLAALPGAPAETGATIAAGADRFAPP